jgi:GntR family transcriptional regulator
MRMIHLNYRDARPIYTQIVDGFREQIAAGVLRSGDKLPSVRELAAELTINPNTIQRAYRELEMGGWIASVHGKGSFVCGVPGEAVYPDELAAFDKAVAAALAAGFTKEDLIRRIDLGGNDHA